MKRRGFIGTVLLMAILSVGTAQKPLDDYFQRPEPAYRWEKRETKRADGVTIYTLFMISQTWQGIEWDHFVQVFYPDRPRFPRFAGLYNTGGRPDAEDEAFGTYLARESGAPFVILYGIPKQPLYNNLYEDALIVYTWQKFIETGDPTWPLHFPMAKAVLKCMDTVQAFLKAERKPVVERFMVTGGSKRGWTAWLVGASRDPRVAGIAPMVIDVLNLPKQVPHHLAFYKGKPSEQIGDYVAGGMLEMLNTPVGQRLVALEDPYSYRDRYTIPKLIINGTNDRYLGARCAEPLLGRSARTQMGSVCTQQWAWAGGPHACAGDPCRVHPDAGSRSVFPEDGVDSERDSGGAGNPGE
jgi:PhoPQ-activated pathogenicity-related protein